MGSEQRGCCPSYQATPEEDSQGQFEGPACRWFRFWIKPEGMAAVTADHFAGYAGIGNGQGGICSDW